MKHQLEHLRAQRGRVISHMLLEILFYPDDQLGSPIDLGLVFEAGPHFIISCKGDGKLLITVGDAGEVPPPPDASILVREIEGLTGGRLQEVTLDGSVLTLQQSTGTAVISNVADQIVVCVDGEPLAPSFFSKSQKQGELIQSK